MLSFCIYCLIYNKYHHTSYIHTFILKHSPRPVFIASLLHCCRLSGRIQREGLLEYQTMSSLRDVAHDGWLCTFTSSWNFHQLAAGQLLSGQPVRSGKAKRYGPSITYKITPAGSLSSSQPGGPPCWTSPLAFGLIGRNLHGVPSRDSNPGLPYSKPAHYRLSYTVPPRGLRRTSLEVRPTP
jgi:hypothetical protein